jgi:hypothetical protein
MDKLTGGQTVNNREIGREMGGPTIRWIYRQTDDIQTDEQTDSLKA